MIESLWGVNRMNRHQLLELVKIKLQNIYGPDYQDLFLEEMKTLIEKWETKKWNQNKPNSEANVYLIVYGDSIYEEGRPTLETLHRFLTTYVGQAITDVHLLPMFPYTSDDGFSVTDY